MIKIVKDGPSLKDRRVEISRKLNEARERYEAEIAPLLRELQEIETLEGPTFPSAGRA